MISYVDYRSLFINNIYLMLDKWYSDVLSLWCSFREGRLPKQPIEKAVATATPLPKSLPQGGGTLKGAFI